MIRPCFVCAATHEHEWIGHGKLRERCSTCRPYVTRMRPNGPTRRKPGRPRSAHRCECGAYPLTVALQKRHTCQKAMRERREYARRILAPLAAHASPQEPEISFPSPYSGLRGF